MFVRNKNTWSSNIICSDKHSGQVIILSTGPNICHTTNSHWAVLIVERFFVPNCFLTRTVIKQWIRQQEEKRVLSLNSCPNYHKDSSQEPICLGSQLSNQRFITPTLQRVNCSGNICEASCFDSINRRANSVKQHSHDALISLLSAFLCHCLSLFQHKQTAQGVKYPVWQVCVLRYIILHIYWMALGLWNYKNMGYSFKECFLGVLFHIF